MSRSCRRRPSGRSPWSCRSRAISTTRSRSPTASRRVSCRAVHTRDARGARARARRPPRPASCSSARRRSRSIRARRSAGWKASGLGPPEHGDLGRGFYARAAGRLYGRLLTHASTIRQRADAREQETLTRVGPGTPMGELLRRYWLPGRGERASCRPAARRGPCGCSAKTSSLFRTAAGAARPARRALPAPRRVARATASSTTTRCAARITAGASPAGACLEMPALRARRRAARAAGRARAAYRVEELGGLVFAYLGPEPAPLLPRYDLFVWPTARSATSGAR